MDNWDTEEVVDEPDNLKKDGAGGAGPAVNGEGAGKKRSD